MAKRVAFVILLGAGLLQAQHGHVRIHPDQDGPTVRRLLCTAYAIADCQGQITGPDWLDTKRYNIEAPPDMTNTQFQEMLRGLLPRFLQFEDYELAVDNGGARLTVRPLCFSKARIGAFVSVMSIIVLPTLAGCLMLLWFKRGAPRLARAHP